MRKSIAHSVIAFIAALGPATAFAMQCLPPLELSNPVTCEIPSSGGTCDFGTSDGIVSFPNQIVTGPVTINGGWNVYVGPGHIKLGSESKAAVAFNNPTNVFVEGLHVDANGYCDVFAVRNQLAHQTSFTFQNVYAEGPAYNTMNANNDPNGPLNCHGDLIQNQQIYGGGLNLTVENFVGVTSGQGFFIPRYKPLGDESTTLRNVYIRETNPVDHTYGLMWFWSPKYDPSHQEHAVSLENVNVGWDGAWLPILPETGTLTADVYEFNHSMISGSVNRWYPDGTDLDYDQYTGLNYDRGYFCASSVPEPPPEPTPEPAPEPVPETIPQWFVGWCNAQKVRKLTCP